MYETTAEVAALQELLDTSRAAATAHLRDIITDDRALGAADLVKRLDGMHTLSVATVTAHGEPRISALDGHFLHGTWTFSTDGSSAKARHLAARPAVSVAYIDGERLGVFAHGDAYSIGEYDPLWTQTLEHWTAHYGSSPLTWGADIRIYRLRPRWMVAFASA
jgi:general stress protein 26